jgi:D-inositol-3-phosphate glycosyltransferase
VDHELFAPGDRSAARRALGLDRKRVLLFVGRLQPLKAADTAIRSLAHLIEWGRIPTDGVRLVIVGGASGEMGAEEPGRLLGLAVELGVSSSVTFVPAQPQSRLPVFYQAADVCLVPSYSESFGLVALEAQACGIPVVGSAVGGLRTIVRHGQTGYLVEPSSSTAFAERAWRILSDKPLAEAMGRLAVCSSAEYSWQRSAAELHDLYAVTRADSSAKRKDAKKLVGSRRNVASRS